MDGFTFNRLKPYTSWEGILPQALELWRIYIEEFAPHIVTRIAVRYINRLSLPAPVLNLSRYLTAPPTVPAGAPQSLRGFLQRVILEDAATGLTAHVTQASERSPKPDTVIILLDIDVHRMAEYSVTDDRLVSTLHALREMKNRIFFASITEEYAETCE
jgi:uncharacterized protein (TIGR04255 family)